MIEQYIGTFWTRVFKDSLFIQGLMLGNDEMARQGEQDLTSLHNALSRHTIDPQRTLIWTFVTYSESDMNQEAMQFNQENVFFDGTYRFGDRLTTLFSLPVDSNIKKIPFILSSPIEPSIILQDGIDYRLDTEQNLLFFLDNPFTKGFQKRFIQTGTDSEPETGIAMWFYRINQDVGDLSSIYAEPVKLGIPESSEYFKRVVNAVWDLRVEGASINNTNKLLYSAVDSDVPTEDGTVEAIFEEGSRTWVRIGDSLFSAPAGTTVLKSVGDSVQKGEGIFGNVQIYYGTDTIPFERFPALHLSQNFIDSSFSGGVLVENKDYPFPEKEYLVLSSTEEGKVLVQADDELIETQVGFDITLLVTDPSADYIYLEARWDLPFKGRPDTVAAFKLYLLSLTASLGHGLTDRIIEDNFGKAPATINLFKEYQSRAFRNNAFFVYIDMDSIPAGVDVGMFLSYLKFTIPAYTTIFTYMSDAASEEYTASSITDSVETFHVVDVDNSYSSGNVESAAESKTSI